jgi:hypothetical protein
MEKIERVDEHSVKVITHDEKVISNQDVYNHYAQLKVLEQKKLGQISKIEEELKGLQSAIEFWKKTALDCEARLPKQKKESHIEPGEVKIE